MSRVISFVLLCFFLNCSSARQNLENDFYTVTNKELLRINKLWHVNELNLEFNQNEVLKAKLSNGLKGVHDEAIITVIEGDNDFLIKQLDLRKINKKRIAISNIKISHKKLQDNIENASKHKVLLSNVIFNKEHQISFVLFAFGQTDNLQGGISIYKKDSLNNWKYFKTVSQWVE